MKTIRITETQFNGIIKPLLENNVFLTEQLVPANIELLKQAMQDDKELHKFLNTPARELPEHYKYLVGEITNDYANITLYTLIDMTLIYNRFKPYFSMSGNKITGFAAYEVKGNRVTELKIFTLNKQKGGGVVLIKDLISLLDNLINTYEKVSWSAFKENPANKIYQKAIEKYNGNVVEECNEFHYTIKQKDNVIKVNENPKDVLPKLGWTDTPKGVLDINKPKNKKIGKHGSYISGNDKDIVYEGNGYFPFENWNDIKEYKEIQNILYEGLITSYPIDKVINNIKKQGLDYNNSAKIYDGIYGGKYIGLDIEKSKIKQLDDFLKNKCGYYQDTIDKIDDNIYHVIYYPKFEQELHFDKNVSFFHITLEEYLPKILKQGLTPRSEGKINKHPDRIYLATSPECVFGLLGSNEFTSNTNTLNKTIDDNHNYVILEIKLNSWCPYKFFSDQQCPDAVYTKDNIHPKYITVVDNYKISIDRLNPKQKQTIKEGKHKQYGGFKWLKDNQVKLTTEEVEFFKSKGVLKWPSGGNLIHKTKAKNEKDGFVYFSYTHRAWLCCPVTQKSKAVKNAEFIRTTS